jgi:hypothetical protein
VATPTDQAQGESDPQRIDGNLQLVYMVMIRYSFPDRGRGQDKRISININIKPLWKCGEFSAWLNQVTKMMYTYKSVSPATRKIMNY